MMTVLSVLSLLLLSADADPNAAAPLTAIEDVSLEDLLNMETQVASNKTTTLFDAPGVVTVVTREEMEALGLRDLQDVLHLVDGFTFAQDVESVTDASFRGVWGHEGKILLMIDGLELNETLYSTLQMGNHYTLFNVERIEIIRGPGSVMYGGNAELAVINVITRDAEAIGIAGLQLQYGQGQRDFLRRDIQAVAGHTFRDLGLSLTGSFTLGQGRRSDGLFTDLYGGTPFYGTGTNERTDPVMAQLNADWGDLHVRLLFDDYRTTDRIPYDNIADRAFGLEFITGVVDVRYDWRLTDKITLTPRLNYRRNVPWWSPDTREDNLQQDYYNKIGDRAFANISVNADVYEGMSVLAGIQVTLDWAQVVQVPGLDPSTINTLATSLSAAGATLVDYQNYAVFAQYLWNNPWVNITAGVRYELHSVYGSSFVPRLALTKNADPFHFKILASEAFRAPGIENIHENPHIRPEHTFDVEVEMGYKITDTMYVGVNLFDLTVRDVIVYHTDENNETYDNFPQTGSRGVEAQFRYHGPYGFAAVDYSLAATANKNEVPYYAVPQSRDQVLGIPMHKGVVTVGAKIGDHLTVGPSFIALSSRYGTLTDINTIAASSPRFLLNVFIQYRNLGIDGLDVGIGGYNLLGETFTYIQPYYQPGDAADPASTRAPLPGLPREVMLRVSYSLH